MLSKSTQSLTPRLAFIVSSGGQWGLTTPRDMRHETRETERAEKYETHASGLADGQVPLVRPLRVEPGRTGCQDNLQLAPTSLAASSEQPPRK